MDWIPAREGIIEADVVRWKEAIWAPKRRRRQNRPWGQQEVTGQIIEAKGDWLSLKVMDAKITETQVAADLKPHKTGTVIRKKRATLLKGKPERLLWSDESARTELLTHPSP